MGTKLTHSYVIGVVTVQGVPREGAASENTAMEAVITR